VSSLIKAVDARATFSKVRPLPARGEAVRPVDDAAGAEVTALRREIADLRRDLAAREEEFARIRDAETGLFRQGEIKGRRQGEAEADQRRSDHLQLLARAVEGARDQLGRELKALEPLALLIAKEAVAKVLGDPEKYGEILCAVVSYQVSQLEAKSIICVNVSDRDFASEEELAIFRGRLGRDDTKIRAVPELAPGDCRIDLTLGSLDVGPRRQIERVAATLEAMAAAEAAA
jgi:type III secretion protein L